MEITIDIGKNVAKQLSDIAKADDIEFEIAALKMLDLGIRIYQSSLEKDKDTPAPVDINGLLNKVMENNYLIKEMIGHVFQKERSMLKTYDAMTAIVVSENMAKSFMDGKATL